MAYDGNGNEIGRNELKSAVGRTKLCVESEEKTVREGEIVYVDISLTGENGIVESNDDRTLSVIVENGELLAFGSAKPNPEDRFDSGTYTTYYGRALAVVRSKEAGTLLVKVNGNGLTENRTEITVES